MPASVQLPLVGEDMKGEYKVLYIMASRNTTVTFKKSMKVKPHA